LSRAAPTKRATSKGPRRLRRLCEAHHGNGGYVFGKLFRGPKLINISPNKTWSGVFGSLILSQFAFLILFLDINYKLNFNVFFFQILLSIIAQFGDILMSYIKRINNKKDTSNFIPGHGGFLDRADGLIWVFIFANFLI